MVIFHSYFSLPEGTVYFMGFAIETSLIIGGDHDSQIQ